MCTRLALITTLTLGVILMEPPPLTADSTPPDPDPAASIGTVRELCRQLATEGWTMEESATDPNVEFRVVLRPPAGLMPQGSAMVLRLLPRRGQFVVYASRRAKLAQAASPETARIINLLNAGPGGAYFEVDIRDGDLRCRMGLDYAPRRLEAGQASQMLHLCAASWKAGLARIPGEGTTAPALPSPSGQTGKARPGPTMAAGTPVMARPPEPVATVQGLAGLGWKFETVAEGLWRSAWRGTGPLRQVLVQWDPVTALFRIEVFPEAGDARTLALAPALQSTVLSRFRDWNWDLRIGAFALGPETGVPRFCLAYPARGQSQDDATQGLHAALILACRTVDSFLQADQAP